MSSSAGTCLGDTINFINYPEHVSNQLAGLFGRMGSSDPQRRVSYGHCVWAIPANIIVNVATYLLAPIVALIQYLAAAVFALFACCSVKAKAYAAAFFIFATHALLDTPFTAIARIFKPTVTPNACGVQCATECMASLCC